MEGREGRRLMVPLLAVNSVVYVVTVGLASWSLDKYIDGHQDHPHLGGNPSTIFLLVYALIAGVIGASSILLGFLHLHLWNNASLPPASTSAIISWAITALAFGLVCKQITMGGHRGKRLQTLEAFIAISGLSQLLYLLLLHAGMFSARYGPAYTNTTGESYVQTV
ncbi:membrane protein PM19L-like [Andrographis paniculata]|uniref:membrane protein PM19L-like n=1 Tax=Andrographis paniculata TaxID=175694 RepID=UPI0021E7091C|nr:membrane protein PM19L-like [Andrographis paniculata]